MAHLRRWGAIWLVNLALSDLLLVGALIAPWAVLSSSLPGLPPEEAISPILALWSAVAGAPALAGSPLFVGLGVVYLAAALTSVGVSARLVRALASKDGSGAGMLSGQVSTALCGICGLFALLVFPALPLGYPYPGVTLMPGLALALVGAVLAISGLSIVRLSQARFEC